MVAMSLATGTRTVAWQIRNIMCRTTEKSLCQILHVVEEQRAQEISNITRYFSLSFSPASLFRIMTHVLSATFRAHHPAPLSLQLFPNRQTQQDLVCLACTGTLSAFQICDSCGTLWISITIAYQISDKENTGFNCPQVNIRLPDSLLHFYEMLFLKLGSSLPNENPSAVLCQNRGMTLSWLTAAQ